MTNDHGPIPKGRMDNSHDSKYFGRYAPSPTGHLHMGNVFAALYAVLRAEQEAGRCFLRWEDLDTKRVVERSQQQIEHSLQYLGFEFAPDPILGGDLQQSGHIPRYENAIERLIQKGQVYACQCSRKEIREQAPIINSESEAVYAGTCRHKELPLDDPSIEVALRFKVPEITIEVDDRWAKRYAQPVQSQVGDFIIKRKDGLIAYQLAVVVDDIFQGITEVVRGRDLLMSAPRQILLYQALGATPPAFAHGPLIVDEAGEKRAKRKGDETLQAMIEAQIAPSQIRGEMGRAMGVNPSGHQMSLPELLHALADEHLMKETIVWPAP